MVLHQITAFVRRLIHPVPSASEIAPLVERSNRQADDITNRLNAIAETRNPFTGHRDPFGALVHGMRGTEQRHVAEGGK